MESDKLMRYELSRENVDKVFEKNSLAEWRNQITQWLEGNHSSKKQQPEELLKDLSHKDLSLIFIFGMLG